MEFCKVEGIYLPVHHQPNRPMKEHLEYVRSLQLREDDVILCAFPRCGTHWLWEVGSMLLSGKAEHGPQTKEHCMLEATSIEDLQQLPSPRLFKTHLPANFLPRQVKDKKVKVIHVYRNVKDVCVSMYNLATGRTGMKWQGNFDDFFQYFLSKRCPLGTYPGYLKHMDTFIRDNPDVPVFSLSFEDMAEDPQRMVKRLGDFLGVSPDPALCAAIVEACSFQKLKSVDNSRDRPAHLRTDNLYRKGVVGDWKNVLTLDQSKRLDDAMKQLVGCRFRFRSEL